MPRGREQRIGRPHPVRALPVAGRTFLVALGKFSVVTIPILLLVAAATGDLDKLDDYLLEWLPVFGGVAGIAALLMWIANWWDEVPQDPPGAESPREIDVLLAASRDELQRVHVAATRRIRWWGLGRALSLPIAVLLVLGLVLAFTELLIGLSATIGWLVTAVTAVPLARWMLMRAGSELQHVRAGPVLVVAAKVLKTTVHEDIDNAAETAPWLLWSSRDLHLGPSVTWSLDSEGTLISGPAWPDGHALMTTLRVDVDAGQEVVLVCTRGERAIGRLSALLPTADGDQSAPAVAS